MLLWPLRQPGEKKRVCSSYSSFSNFHPASPRAPCLPANSVNSELLQDIYELKSLLSLQQIIALPSTGEPNQGFFSFFLSNFYMSMACLWNWLASILKIGTYFITPYCVSHTVNTWYTAVHWFSLCNLAIWRRQWHPTPVLLPGKSHGWRSLVGCSPWGRDESDRTERLHFHALEKEMVTHTSVLAWRIPGTGEPGGLPSMGSRRVGHNWSDLAATAATLLSLLIEGLHF